MSINVFISVGRPFREEQERFLSSVEAKLAECGLRPRTVGRSDFTHGQPLQLVNELMSRCAGTLIIAWERVAIERGYERRGSKKERTLENITVTTPWNQIEAAMSYTRRLPILVLKDENVREEGLLEKGHEWYIHSADLSGDFLGSKEFKGTYDSWLGAVKKRAGWVGFRS